MDPIVKFWMVYRDGSRDTAFRHLSKEAAKQEASRLAGMVPGTTFFVLAAVGASRAPIGPVESISFRMATQDEILDSEIPF